MNIFVISPVTILTDNIRYDLLEYEKEMEEAGHNVYLPYRDTKQTMSTLEIFEQNKKIIKNSDEVHIYFLKNSLGSLFDLGMVFALNKKLVLVNKVTRKPNKSFENFMIDYIGG